MQTLTRQGFQRSIDLETCLDIWRRYVDFRSRLVAQSTVQRDYRRIEKRLEAMKKASMPVDAFEIRDYLLAALNQETARRTIQQLNASFKWAVVESLIDANPFDGMSRQLKRVSKPNQTMEAFTATERDRIIAKFELQYPDAAPWVKFCFWTGCRPEEAAALRWRNVSKNCSEILFTDARPVDVGIVQTIKNSQTTVFPCSPRIKALLMAQQRPDAGPLSWVFTGPRGGNFDYKNFQERKWKPLVNELVEAGEISFYLSQYHTRHTWITLALDHLPVKDVAYLARVSPSVLFKHYASRSRNLSIPEF